MAEPDPSDKNHPFNQMLEHDNKVCEKRMQKGLLEQLLGDHIGEPVLVVKNLIKNRQTSCHLTWGTYKDFLEQELQLGIINGEKIKRNYLGDKFLVNTFDLPTNGSCVYHNKNYGQLGFIFNHEVFDINSPAHVWGDAFGLISWAFFKDQPVRFKTIEEMVDVKKVDLDDKPLRKELVLFSEKYNNKSIIWVYVGKEKVASYFSKAELGCGWKNEDKLDPIILVDLSYLNGLKLMGQNLGIIPKEFRGLYEEKLTRNIMLYLSKIGDSQIGTLNEGERLHNLSQKIKAFKPNTKLTPPTNFKIIDYPDFGRQALGHREMLQRMEVYLDYLNELKQAK